MMLINSSPDVVSNPDVQNIMIFISEHVNEVFLHSQKIPSRKYKKTKNE